MPTHEQDQRPWRSTIIPGERWGYWVWIDNGTFTSYRMGWRSTAAGAEQLAQRAVNHEERLRLRRNAKREVIRRLGEKR